MLKKLILSHCRLACAVVLCGLLSGFAAQDNPVRILDLTEAEMTYPSDRIFLSSPFQVGIPSNLGIKPYILPALSLEIKFDKTSYIMGEEFVYEIRLKNISEIDIRIPLDPDGDKIVPKGNKPPREVGLIETYAKLTVDENREKVKADEKEYGSSLYGPLISFALYGLEKIESSFTTLNPGESMVIRHKGRWNEKVEGEYVLGAIFSEEELKDKVVVHVSAEWSFSCGLYRTLKDVPYNYITRSESIPIEVIIPAKKDKKEE